MMSLCFSWRKKIELLSWEEEVWGNQGSSSISCFFLFISQFTRNADTSSIQPDRQKYDKATEGTLKTATCLTLGLLAGEPARWLCLANSWFGTTMCGAKSDGRIPETESNTGCFRPFFNRKQLIVQNLHCLFPLFRCLTFKVEMIDWQNNKRCKQGGEKQHAHKSRRCNLQVIRIRLGRHAKVKEGSWPEKDSSTGWGFLNM